MNYYVINLSKIKDKTIGNWIDNYHKYLFNNGIGEYAYVYFANEKLKDEIRLLNSLMYLIKQTDLGIGLVHLIHIVVVENYRANYCEELRFLDTYKFKELESLNLIELEEDRNDKIITLGESLNLKSLWGDATLNGIVAAISNVEEYVLWHEVSHLLGVDEHYRNDNHKSIEECKLSTCVMRWAAQSLELCDKALKEIRTSR